MDTIRKNRGLDPELQVQAAIQMRDAPKTESQRLSWTGAPRNEELAAVVTFSYNELLRGRDRSGDNPGSLLAKLGAARRYEGDVPSLVTAALPYMRPGQTRSDVVDDVLSFQRNWMGFKLPSVIRAAATIQNEISKSRGAPAANYEFAIRQIESLFLPPFIAELEDYGLPIPVGVKLASLGLRGDTIEDILSALLKMSTSQRVLAALTRVERWFLSDVAKGLVNEMPESILPS